MRLNATAPMLLSLLLVAACGGGGGGGDPQPGGEATPPVTGVAALAGPWFGFTDGRLEDIEEFDTGSYGLEIQADGTVPTITFEGAPLALTATIREVGSQMFVMTDSNGASYHFWTDASGNYAGLVRNGMHVAVLQKGATALADDYTLEDLEGAPYTGPVLGLTPAFVVNRVAAGSLTMLADGRFEGSVNTTLFYDRLDEDSWSRSRTYGLFMTTYGDDEGGRGWIRLHVSPDRNFVFAMTFDRFLDDPCCDDRLFFLLTRN